MTGVPSCPECKAPPPEIAWLGALPDGSGHWRCSRCGHDWTTPVGEQAGGHLARLQAQNPLWSIRLVTEGHGWTAHRGDQRIWAGTLADLETRLRNASRGTS